MPRGDSTGPAGAGAMTGRGAGYCAGFGAPGYVNGGGGRGRGGRFAGRGFGGGGRGWRHRFFATGQPGWMPFDADRSESKYPDAKAEMGALEQRAQTLRAELDAISQRLGEILPPEAKEK